ncbi:MAG: amidohydrolase family protein [Bauldia sp.]|nr:amidohydrolase family protein [Bauldia sp.]
MADTGYGPPQLEAPAGTCDCHIHFYGEPARYPEAPGSLLHPPPATVTDYRAVMARLGIERVVVVQPTTYGRDNRCTMDGVAELGAIARAVVVVDMDTPDAEMERLTRAGARGVRFHMLPGGALPWDLLEPVAARAASFGWHVQLQLDGRLLPDHEAVLKRLPGDLVVDHTGKFLEPVGADDPAFRALLGLVATGRVWVKLSEPYATSKLGPPDFADVGALARALIAAAPERMLWATNWPHSHPTRPPADDAMMLDVLGRWCPDASVRKRILVDNPARLYGFV